MSAHYAAQSGAYSLAAARRGDYVHVQHILFEQLREDCARLGLHEGDVVQCRSSGAYLLLDTEQGGTIVLERDWARFIVVDEPPT
jgi:hypothetical protein